MTKPDLRDIILAHLRSAGGPISSRELASRFLLIRHDDESTCHRLLAPYLSGHPSLVHTEGAGWSYRPAVAQTPAAHGAPPIVADIPVMKAGLEQPLRDFVALASEGAGPSGSGRIRVVSLQPVVAGEQCTPEHIPDWAAEDDIETTGTGGGPGGRGTVRRAQVVGLETAELQVLVETVGDLPIVCHRVAREVGPLLKACAAASLPFHPMTISLAKLGHLLLGLKARHAPAELAAAIGLDRREPDDCRDRVRLMTECFLALLPMLEEIGITTFDDLLTFQDQPAAPLDFSSYAFTADDLKELPTRPGVYRFHHRDGTVLYIGKAKNLRARLSSYFVPSARGTARGRVILEQVHSFTFEVVASELEALLHEAALLSELRPPLNRQFDIHERPAPYGPRLNLAVLLPERSTGESSPAETCTVHLMRGGRYQRRICAVPFPRKNPGEAGNQWQVLDQAVREVYFHSPGGDARPAPTPGDEGNRAAGKSSAGEVDWQLVGSYLSRYRDEVNVLDVDECDSPETATARLRVLAMATVGGERVVAR